MACNEVCWAIVCCVCRSVWYRVVLFGFSGGRQRVFTLSCFGPSSGLSRAVVFMLWYSVHLDIHIYWQSIVVIYHVADSGFPGGFVSFYRVVWVFCSSLIGSSGLFCLRLTNHVEIGWPSSLADISSGGSFA